MPVALQDVRRPLRAGLAGASGWLVSTRNQPYSCTHRFVLPAPAPLPTAPVHWTGCRTTSLRSWVTAPLDQHSRTPTPPGPGSASSSGISALGVTLRLGWAA